MFVFLPQGKATEKIDASEIIVDRMKDRANEHFEKANRLINEEMTADLKELKEKLTEQLNQEKYIHKMGIAVRIAKDSDVDKKIFLPYVEEILAIKTNNLNSLESQLSILSDVVRVEREHFKTFEKTTSFAH
jgi:predicted nucleic acid-binding protein